jgi:chorismate mutase-like protein
MALGAQGVGADGIMSAVHPDPSSARTTESQQLNPTAFAELMNALGVHRIRLNIDMIDRDLVRLLAARHELAMEIGRMKADRGMPVRVPERERELLDIIRAEAELTGLDADQVETIFSLVLEQSRAAQRRERVTGS